MSHVDPLHPGNLDRIAAEAIGRASRKARREAEYRRLVADTYERFPTLARILFPISDAYGPPFRGPR